MAVIKNWVVIKGSLGEQFKGFDLVSGGMLPAAFSMPYLTSETWDHWAPNRHAGLSPGLVKLLLGPFRFLW